MEKRPFPLAPRWARLALAAAIASMAPAVAARSESPSLAAALLIAAIAFASSLERPALRLPALLGRLGLTAALFGCGAAFGLAAWISDLPRAGQAPVAFVAAAFVVLLEACLAVGRAHRNVRLRVAAAVLGVFAICQSPIGGALLGSDHTSAARCEWARWGDELRWGRASTFRATPSPAKVAQRFLWSIVKAQATFREGDMDQDGYPNYAASLEELERVGLIVLDPQRTPDGICSNGYRYGIVQASEWRWSARADVACRVCMWPVYYFTDESGVLRFSSTGPAEETSIGTCFCPE